LKRKLDNIAASNAELIATGNPGCMMQLGAGLLRAGSPVTVVHPVELLERSYAMTVALSDRPGLLTNHE